MTWWQDVRFAWRMIAKNPWFSAAIVVTLALSIGVNTTVFSLVNGVLRKPLPFPGGERLVLVRATDVNRGFDDLNLSLPDFRDFREQANAFERLEGFAGQSFNISEQSNPPDRFRGGRVSAGLFEMLQVKPVIGRIFTSADEKGESAQAMLIGYGVWTDRYGKDPNVLGRVVRVNDTPATIVGVMPEGFRFPNNEDVWLPFRPDPQWEKRDQQRIMGIGILNKNASIPEAQAGLALVATRLQTQFPATHKDRGVAVRTFHQAMNGNRIQLVFLLMLGAVGFVLLIACANVANMLLSRAIARSREISIRAALGASRWRLIRQLLIESILLSVAGGLLGLTFTKYGTEAFGKVVENVGKPYWIDFSPDYVVLGYFAALSVLAGLIFGIVPALRSSRVDLNEALKEGARSAGGSRGSFLSGALVVFQFALAVILLSGAGLLIRSFLYAQNEFADLRPEQVLHARVSLPQTRYAAPEARRQFYEKLLPRLSGIPGAAHAALVSNPPGTGSNNWRVELKERPIAEPERRPVTATVVASPNYLATLGASLLQGRDFVDSDGLPGKEAALVSRQFAARFYPNQSPIGRQIRLYDGDGKVKPWMTIVGLVSDIRQNDTTNDSHDPLLIVPVNQESFSGMAILLRMQGPPGAVTTAVRREVQQIDPDLPILEAGTLDDILARGRWHLRVFGTIFLLLALIALGMAAVGIYAVMAHSAGQRRREIGVRMALGADVGKIVRLVLARGLIQLSIGAVAGLAAAIALCRLMARLLFGVSPSDPVTFSLVIATLLTAGLAACWIPARRAARLDPVQALRYE